MGFPRDRRLRSHHVAVVPTGSEALDCIPTAVSGSREDGQVTAGSERGLWTLTLVTVAAFGPYVASGVRTEQLVVYGIAALLLPFAAVQLRFPRWVTAVL